MAVSKSCVLLCFYLHGKSSHNHADVFQQCMVHFNSAGSNSGWGQVYTDASRVSICRLLPAGSGMGKLGSGDGDAPLLTPAEKPFWSGGAIGKQHLTFVGGVD